METKNVKTIKHHQSDENSKIYPFGILQTEEGFTPTLGNAMVERKIFKTYKDCKVYIESKPYSLLTSLMCFIVESHAQYQKEQVELLKSKENETK